MIAFLVEPLVATNAPSLLETFAGNQQFLNTLIFIVTVFAAGGVLFGLSIVRTKILPVGAGALIIIGSLVVIGALLAGVSEFYINMGGIVFGLGQVWLGYAVWKKR